MDTDAITGGRLARWRRTLAGDGATPILMVGVCHGADAGRLVVCTTEDTADAELVVILEGAARLMRDRVTGGGRR